MHILIIDNHSSHRDELTELLSDHQLTFADYTECQFKELHYDTVILSGSYEHPFFSDGYAKEIEFIQQTTLPVVGICLGCQLIAHVYGCAFHREEKKVQGLIPIKYIPGQQRYTVYEGHNYCINELCKDLLGVASSEYGYEIIRHAEKPQIGIQFHPEVTDPKNDGALLFTTLLSEIIESCNYS